MCEEEKGWHLNLYLSLNGERVARVQKEEEIQINKSPPVRPCQKS
jgi:hypothetical protein